MAKFRGLFESHDNEHYSNLLHFELPVFEVVVFGVVTPFSDVIGYQHFGGLRCLHLQGEVGDGGNMIL
jgi:hypothetical protein